MDCNEATTQKQKSIAQEFTEHVNGLANRLEGLSLMVVKHLEPYCNATAKDQVSPQDCRKQLPTYFEIMECDVARCHEYINNIETILRASGL